MLRALRIVLVDHMDDVLREALRFENPDEMFGPRRGLIEYRNGELFQDDVARPSRPPLAPESPESPEEQPGLS